MKLFEICYLDDCDFPEYLTTGKSKDEVINRETAKLQDECSCFMGIVSIVEVTEVDGYLVKLIKKRK